jgi:D-arabinose 1-dehydrogenase-like Zn-dependent alcohol dehydrogenase
VRAGDLVAVLRVGGLGHLGNQFAASMGCHTVAIARGTAKEALARKLGAHDYIVSKAQNVAEALTKLGGARIVLAMASDAKATTATIGGLGIDGKIIVLGASADAIEVAPLQILLGRKVSGGAVGHIDRIGRHDEVQRADQCPTDDRNYVAGPCARSLWPDDERDARFRMVLTTGL